MRIHSRLLLAAVLAASLPAQLALAGQLYKDPACACCGKWAAHMQANQLPLVSEDRQDMAALKQSLGVPVALRSCHTARIGQYVIEGHVPASLVKKMLKEKPDIAGLAVAGMPQGSPGMETGVRQAYQVIAFRRDGRQFVYASVKGD